MTSGMPPADGQPFFVLQLVTNGKGEVWPTCSWAPHIGPEHLPRLAAMVVRAAEEMAKMYPPSEADVEFIRTCAANGQAILAAEAVVRAAGDS